MGSQITYNLPKALKWGKKKVSHQTVLAGAVY